MSFPPHHLTPGQWLKQRRDELGLTQKEIGKKVGISEATVSSLETGRRSFTEDVAQSLARFLEIAPNDHEAVIAFLRQTKSPRPSGESAEANTLPAPPRTDALAAAAPPVALAQPTKPRQGYALWVWIGVVLLGILLLLAVRGAWSQNRPAAAAVLNSVADWHTDTCTNQPADSNLIWDNLGNVYNRCLMLGDTIVITPSVRTLLDGEGKHQRTAPLLFQRVRGDFRATVKMDYAVGGACCQHAGLGLRWPGDDWTWLRITKTGQSHKIISEGLYSRGQMHAQLSEAEQPEVRAQIIYFEVIRKSNNIYFAYSLDGQQWTPYWSYEQVNYPEEVEVFLLVYAAHGSDNIPATFTDFTVTPLPAP
jgi:transcriptional regulator with XRE-family HTH domain